MKKVTFESDYVGLGHSKWFGENSSCPVSLPSLSSSSHWNAQF